MERIIDVYYGRDNLPYKDEARTIHFPVAGSEFLGASQTTTIRFHYEQIGTDENVYTVESKRPDGKTGSQLLSKNTTEHYAEMSLSGWYSECKGDLFLSLKVYRGGTTATYNEETQLWEVSGVPVIESTGAIKLAINYTPMGRYENYEDAVETFQQVLAALGDKLDTIKGIVGVSGLSQVDTTEYEEGQLFFNIDDKALYQLVNGSIVPFLEVYSKSEIDALLGGKADKSTTYTKTETDTLLSSKQPLLDSGTNIKTINGESLLGSGNIVIQGGGGSAEWGSIGGNIADQTDLQNEFQDIREVAEGKTKTWVLSYSDTSIGSSLFQYSYYDPSDGKIKIFTDSFTFDLWKRNTNVVNSSFNSQNSNIGVSINSGDVLIFRIQGGRYLLVKTREATMEGSIYNQYKLFHRGDVFLVIETNVPDRWYESTSSSGMSFYKLETSKVDLTNYSTKTETSTEVNKVAHDIATEYDPDTLYGSGDLCIKDKLLYKCNADNTTGTWDSTKWDLTTVNSELGVVKASSQSYTDNKLLDYATKIGSLPSYTFNSVSQLISQFVEANSVPLKTPFVLLGVRDGPYIVFIDKGGTNYTFRGYCLRYKQYIDYYGPDTYVVNLLGQQSSYATNLATVENTTPKLLSIESQRHLTTGEAKKCVGGIQVQSDYFLNLGGGVLLKNPYIIGIQVTATTIDITAVGLNPSSKMIFHKARLSLNSNDDTVAVIESNIVTSSLEDISNLIAYAKAQGWIS